LTEDYLKDDVLFRRSIADIGGMARAVEGFYDHFMKQMRTIDNIPEEDEALTESLRNVDVVVVMQHLANRLNDLYPFADYVDLATPVLAKAILDIPVDMTDIIEVDESTISYKDHRTTGMVTNAYTPP
jgi:hypothetical protein